MTLQKTMSNQASTELDLSKVAALQQKRTLAFVNHFMITTVQFLNNFMKKCEQKLMHFERKLEKVEAAMVLLETRLSSIPEVNTESESKPYETVPESTNGPSTVQNSTTVTVDQPKPVQVEEPPSNAPSKPTYPEYERFVKMVLVGVPLEAVKLKVSLEGLDPNVFANIMGNK